MPRKKAEGANKIVEVGNGIVNWYATMPKELLPKIENPNKDIHGFDIPCRAVVNAPSGSGKTSFILSLIRLFQQGKGTFPDIQVITRNAKEPIYDYLKLVSNDQVKIHEGLQNLPDLDKMDKDENHLIILDDLMTTKDQRPIINYYIRCRKMNCSILYLTQNYFSVPVEIRRNCNYLVILRLSGDRDLKTILRECSLGVEKEVVFKMYQYATREKFMPLIVDLESTDTDHKFRKGFTEYLNPADF